MRVITSSHRLFLRTIREHKIMHLIFVYGTLKSGCPNHYFLTEEKNGVCKPHGIAYTKEKYPLVVASRYNVPYLLYKPGVGHHVEGELYEVDDTRLEVLDKLENHPKLYTRQYIVVRTKIGHPGQEEIRAQAYFLGKFRPQLLELPMLESYKDLIDGKKYCPPKDRDVPAPVWWYEASTDYEKDS